MNRKPIFACLFCWVVVVAVVLADADSHTVSINGSTCEIKNVRVNVSTGQIVFPDANPHVAGAGYWSGGVLTRSAGTATPTPTPTP